MEYRQSAVGMISEAFGISTGIVNLILNDNQQLHKEKETRPVDQWWLVVPPGQCSMPLVCAGYSLHGRQGDKSGIKLNLQSRPASLWFFILSSHEIDGDGDQIW